MFNNTTGRLVIIRDATRAGVSILADIAKRLSTHPGEPIYVRPGDRIDLLDADAVTWFEDSETPPREWSYARYF